VNSEDADWHLSTLLWYGLSAAQTGVAPTAIGVF
jgi:hypothetical protein